jgi:hypothetical protein
MKNIIVTLCFTSLISCKHEKYVDNKISSKDTTLALKNYVSVSYGTNITSNNRDTNIINLKIRDNNFETHYSNSKAVAFKYDNDSLIERSNLFDDEMYNSLKGIYFVAYGDTQSISYTTSKGKAFEVQYNKKEKQVLKIECKGKVILFNEFERNRLFVVTRNENGSLDTIIYSPVVSQ